MKKKFLLIAILLIFILGSSEFYLNKYYPASPEAKLILTKNSETYKNYYTFGNPTSYYGMIFYPGGKVESAAYAPLLTALSQKGIFCVLPQVPFHLAIFKMNAADGIQKQYPQVQNWYMAGHSLGGAVAAEYVFTHSDQFSGLILLAAYSEKDLSQTNLHILTLYGSEDKILSIRNFQKYAKYLPQNAQITIIPGGCHSYFGDYGNQENDGIPQVSRSEQIDFTVDRIFHFLEENK